MQQYSRKATTPNLITYFYGGQIIKQVVIYTHQAREQQNNRLKGDFKNDNREHQSRKKTHKLS